MISKTKSLLKDIVKHLPEKLLLTIFGKSCYQSAWQKKWHIHTSACIGRFSVIETSGGVMIGQDTYLDSRSHLFSSENSFSYAQDKCVFGDIILGNNVKVVGDVHLQPGMIIPDNTVCTPATDLYRFINNECLFSSIDTNHTSQRPIFILSTGRAGSTSFARAFDNLLGYQGKHESIKAATILGYLKEHQPKLFVKYKSSLINRLKYAAHCAGKDDWVESDQRLYNLIPELLECFPQARFIHCVREKESFIQSAASRGWYKQNNIHLIWERFRPHPTSKDDVASQWDELTQFQKLSWYYHHVNNEIQVSLLNLVDSKNWIRVSLEDADKETKISDFVNERLHFPKLN